MRILSKPSAMQSKKQIFAFIAKVHPTFAGYFNCRKELPVLPTSEILERPNKPARRKTSTPGGHPIAFTKEARFPTMSTSEV